MEPDSLDLIRQAPQHALFETVVMPEKMLDPSKRNGRETADVTNRGPIPRGK